MELRMKAVRYLVYASLLAATKLIVEAYLAIASYLSLPRYANGTERMPFQGRMLMMWPMRWAENSSWLQHWTGGRQGMKTPELVVIVVTGLLSLTATGVLVTVLFRKISSVQRLPYLPYAVLLVICIFNFCLIPYSFPYDLPSLMFFTLGVYLIYMRRFWGLLVMFPIATLNRETTLFLIPLLAMDAIAEENAPAWGRLRDVRLLLKLTGLSAIWIVLQIYVRHQFAGNVTEMGPRVLINLMSIANPGQWIKMLSACAFLLPFVLLLRRRIEDARFRAYMWIIPAWVAFMFFFGLLLEVRIYGELSGLIAVAATLTLEGSLERPEYLVSEQSRQEQKAVV
jgi:hypothetical protein